GFFKLRRRLENSSARFIREYNSSSWGFMEKILFTLPQQELCIEEESSLGARGGSAIW
ncbi:hypothetical protein AMECASPLE_032223, partial [Ameca splendens]